MNQPKNKRLLYVMLAGLILLTVAGLALLAGYFLLSRSAPPVTRWANPMEAVLVDSVAPDLAVLPLAGYDNERVIKAALDAGELETAYTVLVHSLWLPDAVRAGHWLLLAGRYGNENPGRAAVAYQAALDAAALSPGLSDVARADISLQAAKGLAAAGSGEVARLALTQAESIARYSLTLLPAQRRAKLREVAVGYRAAGDAQTAASIERTMDTASAGPAVRVEAPPMLLSTLRGSVVLSSTVTAALAARQQAAAEMAALWLNSGVAKRDEQAQTLGTALLAEDSARADFYAGEQALPLPDRLAMLHDRVDWLTIKYQAARRAYGVSLVPAWEEQAVDIRQQLATAYTDLINGYGQQLDLLSAGEAAFGRVELLRQGVLWTRLGLFPDHAEQPLSEQLTAVSRQLWTRQGGAGLIIVVQEPAGQRYYLLSGQDAGQGN